MKLLWCSILTTVLSKYICINAQEVYGQICQQDNGTYSAEIFCPFTNPLRKNYTASWFIGEEQIAVGNSGFSNSTTYKVPQPWRYQFSQAGNETSVLAKMAIAGYRAGVEGHYNFACALQDNSLEARQSVLYKREFIIEVTDSIQDIGKCPVSTQPGSTMGTETTPTTDASVSQTNQTTEKPSDCGEGNIDGLIAGLIAGIVLSLVFGIIIGLFAPPLVKRMREQRRKPEDANDDDSL